MTLEKAKTIVTRLSKWQSHTDPVEVMQALELAAAAIDALVRSRSGDPPLDGELLPGETEE